MTIGEFVFGDGLGDWWPMDTFRDPDDVIRTAHTAIRELIRQKLYEMEEHAKSLNIDNLANVPLDCHLGQVFLQTLTWVLDLSDKVDFHPDIQQPLVDVLWRHVSICFYG